MEEPIMKIVIVGTGGVGGYYGAKLAQSGNDVTFIARGSHLTAMRQKGLQIRSVLGDVHLTPVKATDRPSDIGKVDLMLFTVKTYQTEDAAAMIKPIIGSDTVILPLQNGIDATDRIGSLVGMEHMVGGTTWISASVEAPGVIGHYSQFHRIALGELNGTETPRLKAVFETLKGSGVTVEISGNIQKVLWIKFVFISAISALGSLTRVTLDEYRSIPETRKFLESAVREVSSVGQAAGVALDPDVVEKTLEFIDVRGPGMKPSMQRDVETGKPSELESMIGIVVRLGELHKVSTPVMGMVYAMLKPRELLATRKG